MKVLEGKVIEIELEFLIDGLTTKIILKGDTTSAIKRSLLKKSPIIGQTDIEISFFHIVMKLRQ